MYGQMFPGPGTPHSLPVMYTGPGDIATFEVWAGLRCYSSTYSGNVAQVWDAATGTTLETLLTCSSGGTINQTINPLSTTCTAGCVVKILYDQTGGGFNLTQSTLALMPTYTANCIGSTKPCMTLTTSQVLSAASGLGQFQPYSFSMVAERTSGFTQFTDVMGGLPSGNAQFGFNTSTNAALSFASAVVSAPATDSTFHGMQALFSGASSTINIDGSSTSVNPGTNGIAGDAPCLGKCPNNNGSTIAVTEIGIANGDISSNFAALNTNQHSYWGF